MKRLLALLLLLACASANAQFTPGQVLTAAQLNSAFTATLPLAGGTLTGPLTVPTVTTGNAQITGGAISGVASPSFTGTLTVPNASATTSVASPSLQTNLMGWPGLSGTYWQSQYHANWNVVQSQIASNPTEWQVYTNAAQGIAQTQNGTNQLVLQGGTNFSSSWVGFPYLYCNGTQYKVATFTDTAHITVQTPAGGAVTFGSTANCTYYFAATTTTSTVNVSGTAVTYVSGQPFVSIFDNGQVYVNGTAYSATYNSPTSITLGTNLGTLTGATLNQYANINNELATLRLQGLNGANEENVALTFRPDGAWLETLYAGSGQYRPMFFAAGENPAGTISPMISMYPASTVGNPGQLSLGGTGVTQAVQINQGNTNVNYLLEQGAATGVAPTIAARGSDSTVALGLDVQGANNVNFTSHNFGSFEFKVFGVGGTSYLAVGSSSSAAPTISANGVASNIAINLAPKGTSPVTVASGGLQLPVTTVASLPTCNTAEKGTMYVVSDANGPTYNSTVAGSGSTIIPVFCNGTNWTAH